MSLGKTPSQGNLYGSSRQYCEDRLSPTSIYRLLHVEGGRLFPDEAFADLFQDVGLVRIRLAEDGGGTIRVHLHEKTLQRTRRRQTEPAWRFSVRGDEAQGRTQIRPAHVPQT